MMSALQKAEQEEDLERWHFCFRAFCWEGSDPVRALRQLSELCRRWLRPDLLSKEQILDRLVLEQLLITAPEDLQVQVRENRVRSCEELEELLQGRGRPPQASIVICEGQKFLVRDAEVEVADQASELDATLDLSTRRWTSERTEEPSAGQGEAVPPEAAPEDGDAEVLRAPQPPEQELRAREEPLPAAGPGPAVTQGGADAAPEAESQTAGPAAPERDPARRRPEPPSPRAARPALHRCGDCHKAFAYRSQLVIHERSHTGERPFRCERCGRGFMQPSDLRVHGRIHTGERPFRCRLCPKAFTHESTLLGHLRVHTREQPYVCERCGKGFSHRGNLNVHARIHTQAKPYVCPVCGHAFRQLGTMKRHHKIHGQASAPDGPAGTGPRQAE